MGQKAGDFFDVNGLFAQTGRLILRVPVQDDLPSYIETFAPGLRDAYLQKDERGQKLREGYWSDVVSDGSLFCTIVDITSHKRLGFCCIEELVEDELEVGISLLPQWRGKGFGKEAIQAFMCGVERVAGPRPFIAKIDARNVASQCLFRGLGFVPAGVDTPIFSDPKLLALIEEQGLCLIDDRLRVLAQEFGVEARTLLSHVLVFRRDLNDFSACQYGGMRWPYACSRRRSL